MRSSRPPLTRGRAITADLLCSGASQAGITAPRGLLDEGAGIDDGHDPFKQYQEQNGSGLVNTKIADRESEVRAVAPPIPASDGALTFPPPPDSQYQARRRNRALSPERGDAFAGETPARSYKDIMMAQNLEREEQEVLRKIEKKREAEGDAAAAPPASEPAAKPAKKRRRWDDTGDASATAGKSAD